MKPTPESVEKAREIEGPCRYGQHPSCLSPTCGPCIRTLRCALALDAERAAGKAEGMEAAASLVDTFNYYDGNTRHELATQRRASAVWTKPVAAAIRARAQEAAK